MERMTRYGEEGYAYLRREFGAMEAIQRLAAYEDTGLEPEQVEQMTKTEAIPIRVMERAIVGINAAEQCDQAGHYDYELRRALKTVLEWYRAPVFQSDVYCSKRDGWIPKWWPEAALGGGEDGV